MASEIFNKFLNAFGLETEEEPFVSEHEVSSLYEEAQEQDYERGFSHKRRNKVVRTLEGDMSMVLVKPKDDNDAQIIIDYLLKRKPVIVNMEDIDFAQSQRVMDFVSGAIYALNGDVKSISQRIYAFLPSNIELSTGE